MGKKSRQKHNRQQKNSSSQRVQPHPVQPRSPLVVPSLSGGLPISVPVPRETPVLQERTPNFGEQTEYVRSDIFRISLLLIAVGLVLAILFLVNLKTPYLKDTGRKLTSFFRLQ